MKPVRLQPRVGRLLGLAPMRPDQTLSCTSNSKSGGGFLAGAKEVPDYEYYIDPGYCRYSDMHLSVWQNRTDQQRSNDDDGQ